MQLQEGMLACSISYYSQYKYLSQKFLVLFCSASPSWIFWQANALIPWVPMHPMIQKSAGILIQKFAAFW